MTDLEDLWNNLPVSNAPMDDIVRAGRARRSHWGRTFRRPLVLTGAALALATSFIAGMIVANPPDVRSPFGAPTPVAFQADLKPVKSCRQLLSSYQERALPRVTSWGWRVSVPNNGVVGSYAALDGIPLARRNMAPVLTEHGSSSTGTNIQEATVDEPDVVKTNGTLVVRLRGTELQVWDVRGRRPEWRSTVHLRRFSWGSLLLDGDTVVALGTDTASQRESGSRVISISIDDPDDPEIKSTVAYSSRIVTARMIGSNIHLVLSSGVPELNFVSPHGKSLTEHDALLANRRVVRESTVDDWLPTYSVNGKSKRLLDCSDVAVPPGVPGVGTVSVVGFDPSHPTRITAVGLAAPIDIAYASDDHLVLAASPTGWGRDRTGTSHLYDFRFDGTAAIHQASGEVEGTIADQWSLDESDDVIRVAVGSSSETGDFNSVVTLKKRGKLLAEIGRLDHLGPKEEIKSVRWFDDVAVLVTYRTTDPVYTVDMSEPSKLRLLGELKVPGFSDYLHPIGHEQILGVGMDPSIRGIRGQVALFDGADLGHVQRKDVVSYRKTEPLAGEDPRLFTWLPEQRTALVAMRRGRTGLLAEVRVHGQKLESKLRYVEYGDDINDVRTFTLPDGRIVLVTGEKVQFMRLQIG